MNTLTKIVCDFCTSDVTEAWCFTHGSFRFMSSGYVTAVEAGEAAACATCRSLVEVKLAPALLARCLSLNRLSRGQVDWTTGFQAGVLRNLSGDVRHIRLGDAVEPPARFFTRPCPRCQAPVHLDRAEAREQALAARCGACGWRFTVGVIGHKGGAV